MSKRRDKALSDLFFFQTEYMGLDLEEKPHREMSDAVQYAVEHDECPNVARIVPRGTYKSTMMRGEIIWSQLRQIFLFKNYYHRILLASATLALMREAVAVIAYQLENNPKIVEDFGQLYRRQGYQRRNSRVLQGDGIVLVPRLEAGELASILEPNIFIGSLTRTNTGWHADGAGIDDLHDDKHVQTPEQREKAKRAFALIWPIINPTDRMGKPSRMIINATRWHDDDVPGMLMQKIEERTKDDPTYKSRWTILQRSDCTDPTLDEGELYFPSKHTRQFLREKLDDMGPYLFSCQYLNDPIGTQGFTNEEQIKFVPRAKFPVLSKVRALVDPNQHGKAQVLGCWTAILVVGFDRFFNLYIMDARGSRDWDSRQFVDALFELDQNYRDNGTCPSGLPILVENEHMAHFDNSITLKEELDALKHGFVNRLRIMWVPVPRDKSYEDRWMVLQPRFRRGQIYFAEEIEPRIKREIVSELIRGRASKYSDFLDALAMAEFGLRPKVEKQGASPLAASRNLPEGAAQALMFSDYLPNEVVRKLVQSAEKEKPN
jgi:hypothetical protein